MSRFPFLLPISLDGCAYQFSHGNFFLSCAPVQPFFAFSIEADDGSNHGLFRSDITLTQVILTHSKCESGYRSWKGRTVFDRIRIEIFIHSMIATTPAHCEKSKP